MRRSTLVVLAVVLVALLAPTHARAATMAAFTFSPASPVTGQAVAFNGSTSTCSATPCTYTWNDEPPGGGVYPLGSGQTLSFTFKGAGTKYVTLHVKDAAGGTAQVEHNVVVTQATGCQAALWCADPDAQGGTYNDWQHWQWSLNNPRWAYADAHPNVGDSECKVIASPVHTGAYASQCSVYPTDGVSAKDRAELNSYEYAKTMGDASQVQFYGWWAYFPALSGGAQNWWSNGGDFNDVIQFGQYQGGASSWMYMGVDATPATVSQYGAPALFAEGPGIPAACCGRNKVILAPLQYGHWFHFVVEARWSQNPAVGYLQIWVDGQVRSPKTYAATLVAPSTGVGISQGIYRKAYTSTNTVIDDGLCRASSYAGAAAC